MKIQILHVRQPDDACSIEVYVDGRLVNGRPFTVADVDVEVEDIDPGRGYDRADWDERTAEAEFAWATSGSSFDRAVLDALVAEADSEHIH